MDRKLKNIIKIEKGKELVSSVDIAKFSKNELRAVHQLIRTHEKDLKDFGDLLTLKNFKDGHLKCYTLNEYQTTFLLTLMKNNEVVVRFKNGEFEVTGKTIMRKKNFKTSNKTIRY